MSTIVGTATNFDELVLNSDIPVLVDLWAPWCGPCRQIAQTIQDIAEEYTEKIKVVKVNIDDNPSIAANYKVMSIPTLLIFNKGDVEGQIIGLVSKNKIIDKFSNLI